MKILVIGGGAVGGFVGGALALAGEEVTLVSRNQAMAAAIRSGGLILEWGGARRTSSPRCVSSISEAFSTARHAGGSSGYELVIFATKSYDTEGAARELSPFLRAKSGGLEDRSTDSSPPEGSEEAPSFQPLILTLQNGIGNEEVIARATGGERLVAGILTTPVERGALNPSQPGLVTARRSGGIGLAPVTCMPGEVGFAQRSGGQEAPSGERERWREVSLLATLFSRAGFKVQTVREWQALKWSKLILNLMANASCAILRMDPLFLYRDKRLVFLEQQMIRETLQVMKKLGIPVVSLPGYAVSRWASILVSLPPFILSPVLSLKVSRARGGKEPSLLMEFKGGKKRSEVQWLNGSVQRCGKEAGVPTPVNATLTRVMEGIVQGTIPWEEYAGSAEALLKEVSLTLSLSSPEERLPAS